MVTGYSDYGVHVELSPRNTGTADGNRIGIISQAPEDRVEPYDGREFGMDWVSDGVSIPVWSEQLGQ